MATTTSNKRAREEIAVPRFDAVDLGKFVLKDNGKGKSGHRTFPLIDGNPIRFNLTPDKWLSVPFGFDLSSKFEKPSFLVGDASGNDAAPKASEGLNLRVFLEGEESEFLKKLDELCKEAFAKIVSSCSNWNDAVASGSMFSANSVKVAVPLTGPDAIDIAVVRDGAIARGQGWDFIKPFAECFRNADVKLTVRVKKIWHMGNKAGIKLEATQLALRVRERPKEAVAFTDDDLLA
jgi:hypothetical protein